MRSKKWNTAPTLKDLNPNWDEWANLQCDPKIIEKPKSKRKQTVWPIWKRLWRTCRDGQWTNREYCKEHQLYDHCSFDWLDFDTFFNDVGPRPLDALLVRPDPSKPFGPDNFKWTTRSAFISRACSPRVAANICHSILEGRRPVDVARDLGVSRRTVYRIVSGKTHTGLFEEIKATKGGTDRKKAEEICESILNGELADEVTERFEVTRKEVQNIITGLKYPGLFKRMKFLQEEFN